MSNELEGKVAFITGAARGQGRAHAVKLASMGADIVAVDIAGPVADFLPYPAATPDDLVETVRLVEELDRRILGVEADVRDRDALKGAADRAVAELGSLDIVVANAGICEPAKWQDISQQSWQDTIDINLTGVWNTITATAQHLIDGGKGGAIVITSSYAGKKVQPMMIHYTASKHALVGLTRGFAIELGPHNIRVNSVHPGAVATPMGGGDTVDRIEASTRENPKVNQMGQAFLEPGWMEPEAIANAVAFLVSPASATITSEHLSVDQGMQYF
ncbi:mycofactocin-coupled SDR family oxidoreductase [Citricoccus sp. K5]|uniref:mycofactocin-coupled SDR family oxidoreductase n=1 Tax=Citricoccus sp. K5 TaxID=2653135 RepID=UPI0012F3AC6A|nr:mycofactocin-coupled SDR family oxidoreductase [Citricoccus sp. K5]VXB30273.1 Putative short-chain type dehydrogenase/reductase MSMEG_6031/MSMEI_5872 [Citricoccus sp. K5]